MAVSVNQILANTLGLADPLGRVADDGRVGFNGRVNINGRPIRFAPNFDGVDDYGVLPYRAINPDGDIDIEWEQRGYDSSPAGAQTIVSQATATAFASREFVLRSNTNESIELTVGGVSLGTAAGVYGDGKWRSALTGNTWVVYKDGQVIQTATFNRGAAREPTAVTSIAARNASGTFFDYMRNGLYNIRINGTLWPIADRNQAIQLPEPSGLGAELITPTVLENPAVKGSQWTYLGSGRWQYVGDGSLNELRFINAVDQPAAGYLEFEIESISGQLNCTSGNNSPAAVFNTIGVKRYFYTAKGSSNENTFLFKRHFSGVGIVTSCVIKNISFRPLGTCNPMTLVNVTSDRWQEVPQ